MRHTFDFVVIGAGPAGEAAAHKARELGATVAVVDRRWFGGSCPHIGCVPSKALLHARRAPPQRRATTRGRAPRSGATTWSTARRTPPSPTTRSHVKALEDGRRASLPRRGPDRGPRPRRPSPTTAPTTSSRRRTSSSPSGSTSKVPPIEGLADASPGRTSRRRSPASCRAACSSSAAGRRAASSPRSIARFGVPATIVQSGPAARPDGPSAQRRGRSAARSSATGSPCGPACARSAPGPAPGTDGAHVIDLDDGSTAEGHVILLAVGRDFPVHDLGPGALRRRHDAGRTPYPRDGRLRVADGLWVVGDPAGPELHTHQGHYQGELAVRMALGEDVAPDYRALPRATYMDPEAASVGRDRSRQAREAGLDAFECVADFPKSAKGYSVEAETGHVTIVVDRGDAGARRRGDGLPGRVRRDPRVRARDQGAGAGRRPGRDDPRLPVDVADLQRAVRRGAGELDAPGSAVSAASGAPSALDRDLAVDEHEPRPGVPQRPAGLDRLLDRGRREHDEVGAVPGRPAGRGRARRR